VADRTTVDTIAEMTMTPLPIWNCVTAAPTVLPAAIEGSRHASGRV
jgi:hypothetical protein